MCDDVAVLVAQRMPAPEALSLRLDADTLDLGELHGRISAWLDDLGAGLADHISLGHALMELATNVVNHAYRRSDLDGRLGRRPRRPSPADRGRPGRDGRRGRDGVGPRRVACARHRDAGQGED